MSSGESGASLGNCDTMTTRNKTLSNIPVPISGETQAMIGVILIVPLRRAPYVPVVTS